MYQVFLKSDGVDRDKRVERVRQSPVGLNEFSRISMATAFNSFRKTDNLPNNSVQMIHLPQNGRNQSTIFEALLAGSMLPRSPHLPH